MYISAEFQQERNADSVCLGEFCSGAQSVNLVCRQKALHNCSVLKRKASPRTRVHADDVEFEWLGEDVVFINYTLPNSSGVWDANNPLGQHCGSLGGCLVCGSAREQKCIFLCVLTPTRECISTEINPKDVTTCIIRHIKCTQTWTFVLLVVIQQTYMKRMYYKSVQTCDEYKH